MAKEGFKRKLAAIISIKATRYSRLVYDPKEPMLHNPKPYRTSETDLAQQYWLTKFFWTTGCDERK